MNNNYWRNYWLDNSNTREKDLQKQVGRTKNKIPIDKDVWNDTLKYINNLLDVHKDDIVLDFCAGNGLISKFLSDYCTKVIALDISSDLLMQVNVNQYKNIDLVIKDACEAEFENEQFSKIIFYFAIQHFNEQEIIALFDKFYKWMKPQGTLFIGDIPDITKIWRFFNTDDRKNLYVDSIINEKPIIGTWYSKQFLRFLGKRTGFSEIRIINQPEILYNSHYRFDIILKK